MRENNNNNINKKILKLLGRRNYGLTIEEISNSLGINRGTASKYLAILEAEKKIIVREVGKAKLHYLGNKILGLI
jgi:predicted transcriptional regulator